MNDPLEGGQTGSNQKPPRSEHRTASDANRASVESESSDLVQELEAVEASLALPNSTSTKPKFSAANAKAPTPALVMVETAFLASTASLLWLVSYYLSIGPWMRILFPTPIALVYLRWGKRAAWMSAIVSGLLLSVLMGPYLSLLFFVPYGLLGIQLGAMWKRHSPWFPSIGIGTLIATFGFFFRVGLLSIFLGEDLWAYLTNRITDFLQWGISYLVDWGWVGVELLGQTNLTVVQIMTLVMVLCSDIVYLFTVHLAAWLLLDRLGNPIPDPPEWVQALIEEE
ncbi:MAG: hypothetical protein Kow00121_08070 [Elainellaceae cyanobacterium]